MFRCVEKLKFYQTKWLFDAITSTKLVIVGIKRRKSISFLRKYMVSTTTSEA